MNDIAFGAAMTMAAGTGRQLAASPRTVITLRDVKRYFMVGDFIVKALDGVSLDITRGDFMAIMGLPDQESRR
jgi:ABC-type glutathione transport system ATPase component